MRAAVVRQAGTPEVLVIEDVPVPVPTNEQVLIRVHAVGLNRSELFTRQGHSPNVQWPRILGIEAVGRVIKCPSGRFEPGTIVATAMGGMGRDFDGGYAQCTCVSIDNVQSLVDEDDYRYESGPPPVPWEILGAMPEMIQTAYGSLMTALQLKRGDKLLIRGGTSSVGLMAASLAAAKGAQVWSSTRSTDTKRVEILQRNGAKHIVKDDGAIHKQFAAAGLQMDKVLELIGVQTLRDSLLCTRKGGIVCNTGILGNTWTLENINPMEFIPTAVCLTSYAGGPEEFMQTPLKEMVKLVRDGKMHVEVGKVMKLDQVAEAHKLMESNEAGGKVVLLVD